MFGAISGLVAGLVMAPFIMITAILAGMPPDTMLIAMGLIFGTSFSKFLLRLFYSFIFLTISSYGFHNTLIIT